MIKSNISISENDIIYKYLKKLNFNKVESFNFKNDGAFLKTKSNKVIIVTNDSINENIDFFRNDSPESVAQKIVTYNLSDLSSMGADPYSYTLSLSFPTNIGKIWIKNFTKKLFYLQKKYNFFLLGGDIGKSDEINISANFFGYVKKNHIIKRNSSKIGDSIWVSGYIGQSHIGLLLKQKKIFINKKFKNYFINKYLFPQPCMFGSNIVSYANSCIDISDGFFGDLSKLLNKNMGVNLYYSNLPFSKYTKSLISKKIVSPDLLLNAGDDYQLIFTSSPMNDAKIISIANKNKIKITKVGKIIKQNGIYFEESKINILKASFQYHF